MQVEVRGFIECRDLKELEQIEKAVNTFRSNFRGRTDYIRDKYVLWALKDVSMSARIKLNDQGQPDFDVNNGYTLFYRVMAGFDGERWDKAMKQLKELVELIRSGRIKEVAKEYLNIIDPGRVEE